MKREFNKELNKAQSLMERMEQHLTLTEAHRLYEKDDERNDTVSMDGNVYELNNPKQLIQLLSKEGYSPKKSWYVTLGYVKKFDKLGNKTIRGSVDAFNQDDVDYAKSLNSDMLNSLVDNPQMSRGKISNPYVDSYSNYIVEVQVLRLMYGRNEEYGIQKQNVKNALGKYQDENPELVQNYLQKKGLIDFTGQSYDDARANNFEKIPNVNGKQRVSGVDANGNNVYGDFQLNFNTPKTVYKKLRSAYFIIKDEGSIEEISADEANAYARLYGVTPVSRVNNDEADVQAVDKAIKDIKAQYHGGDVWTNYSLDSVFLLKFSLGNDNNNKLIYYNPNAIVEFVKSKDLKSGSVPSRRTNAGVFKPHFDRLKED